MVWAVMFQGITVFVFIIIFCNDKHNQAIVSRKKRFLYSTLLFIGTDFLLRLFLVKESQILILFNIFGLSVPLLNILDVIKGAIVKYFRCNKRSWFSFNFSLFRYSANLFIFTFSKFFNILDTVFKK